MVIQNNKKNMTILQQPNQSHARSGSNLLWDKHIMKKFNKLQEISDRQFSEFRKNIERSTLPKRLKLYKRTK